MSRINWWLDYVEKELEPAMRAQMKAILKKSPQDQKIVEEIQSTKDLIKAHDVAVAESAGGAAEDDFFAQIESKIMAQVEKTEIKKISAKDRVLEKVVSKLTRHRKHLARSAMLAGIVTTAFLTYQFVATQSLNTRWDVTTEIAQHVQTEGDIASLMTYQSEHDFLVDVASQSLDHLTKEQFELLMGDKQVTR